MDNPVIRYREVLSIVEATTKTLTENWRNTDGGWGKEIGPPPANDKRESDTWTMAGVALWLTNFDAEHYQPHIEFTLRKLRESQRLPDMIEGGDGGWGLLPGRRSDSNSTALSLFAHTNYFRRRGLPVKEDYREQLQSACDWLVRAMRVQGGMPDEPGNEISLAFNTCWSILALADCLKLGGLDPATVRTRLLQTLEYVVGPHARKQRGWGWTLGQPPDVIGTAYCMYVLQCLLPGKLLGTEDAKLLDTETAVPFLEAAGGVLRAAYKPDGSWKVPGGYSPIEGTAWSIVALLATGEPADSPFIQNGIRYLIGIQRLEGSPKVGWPQFPGEQSVSTWMTCYACYALWTYGQAVRQHEQKLEDQATPTPAPIKIFISHGHTDLYQQVVSLLTNMNPSLRPIVMKNEPAKGMEENMDKLRRLAEDCQYAIIIDDDQRPNVLHELGYFMNKLPSQNIWLLLKKGLEPPSNVGGRGYIEVDESGSWAVSLIQGIRVAGLIS